MLLINFEFYFQQIYWFLLPKYIKKQMYLYLQWPRLFNLQREKKYYFITYIKFKFN